MIKNRIFKVGILVSTVMLSTLNASDISKAIMSSNQEGTKLPYTILRSDILDVETGKPFEIRNGGYGSDMVAHPSNKTQFYALTDRGPNATYTGTYGKGKMFPVPEYTPRIGQFEIQNDGTVILIKEILLKRPDGTLISGLPNSSDFGGTGETPYNAEGEVIRLNMSKPFDKKMNPIKLDDYGLDGEGLVALSDGTFWVSDEYGPHIVHFDKNGVELERINAFHNDKRGKIKLPAEFQNRRANRGMEGLAISLDESTLIGIMQSTMLNPSKKVKDLDLTRIVTINPKTGKVGQYLYKQNKKQNSNSGIVAVGKNKFYVIERDGSFLLGGPKKANPKAQKHIYEIDLNTGTNLEDMIATGKIVQDEMLGLMLDGLTLEEYVLKKGWKALSRYGIKPVSKKLVLDMVEKVKYPHDKMEGMWIIDTTHVGIINDDDFATWSTKNKLHAKKLDNKTIDSNTLYIVEIK